MNPEWDTITASAQLREVTDQLDDGLRRLDELYNDLPDPGVKLEPGEAADLAEQLDFICGDIGEAYKQLEAISDEWTRATADENDDEEDEDE